MRVTVVAMVVLLAVTALHAGAVDVDKVRQLLKKNNVTSIYVFGDSSVDPGNNNGLVTDQKANFLPYGKDFFAGPTGRFTNGRVATDFLAEALGFTKGVRAYLDPKFDKPDLLHGVSFASGGSGYDDVTANITNAISFPHQLQYFKRYKIKLAKLVGGGEGEKIVSSALYVVSMGTNDFLENYYIEPIRSEQYTVEAYTDYLVSCMYRYLKDMLYLGARKIVLVGLQPFGCIPLVKTLKDTDKCDETYNKVAFTFNSKIKEKFATLKAPGLQSAYVDIYSVTESAIRYPQKYGFTETSKGCCGTGTTEYGPTCKGLSTCPDRTKYVFWDAVHPTEEMHKIIANEAVKTFSVQGFFE
ncbi:hypothetical protein RJ639_027740 [Escallonia herrerae]|uniref:GDSL esterase/lipase n=1 Tax=Escallonia herrerae TaxID=1293975 RepID=A0AA88XJ92_9ASTE|nr:hypothetical protein RJ639_027740 [Escallonia herrerae]